MLNIIILFTELVVVAVAEMQYTGKQLRLISDDVMPNFSASITRSNKDNEMRLNYLSFAT